MSELLVRAALPKIIASREAITLVAADGSVRRLDGDAASLAEAVLAFTEEAPRSRSEIRAHVESLAGAPLLESTVLDELVTLLRASGALVTPRTPTTTMTHARAIVALSGAVAAAHAPRLVQALMAMGFEVRVITTERALRFVAKDALEVLTHGHVLSSMWPNDGESLRVPHIELAAWADVVIVWPASATTISRIATGDCSELVSAVAITTRAPVLIAPSMNEAMLDAPSVARNLETLRGDRFHIAMGTLAHEVADAPIDRRPERGGAADPISLAELALALVRTSPRAPHDAASWESFHRRVPEDAQPWVGEADPIVLRLLDEHAQAGASIWDVGTGHGAIAIAAAARGHRVVATDVSDTALERARARGDGADVVWLRDDITASALRHDFDVVVDRGTLHTLSIAQRARYVETIASRMRSLSIAIVTTQVGMMNEAELTATFGPRFEVVATVHGAFAGSLTPAPASVTLVLRRTTR